MKKLLKINFITLLMLCFVTACSSDSEKEEDFEIQVPNTEELTQTAYADEVNTGGGFTFVAKNDWTATVTETTSARASGVEWLRLMHDGKQIDNGKVGTFTLKIALETNYTGEKRSATISLMCKGCKGTTITVEQQAVTKKGESPKPEQPEPSGSGVLKNETTGETVNLVGVEHSIGEHNMVIITFVGETKIIAGKEQSGKLFPVHFCNPLQDGKLKTGIYTIKNINELELQNGECGWIKSSLGSYGKEGTIKVECENNEYTFTVDIKDESEAVIKGSFIGVPKYLNEEVKVEGISLNESSKALNFGSSFRLEAIILPENATDKRYSWSSSNTDIATVDEKGLVTAVAAGSVNIRATSSDGGKTATCEVIVASAIMVQSIAVEPTEITLLKGEFYEPINVRVLPEDATDKSFNWKSDSESIADFKGGVYGKEVGTTFITFTTKDGAKTAKLKVTVQPRPISGNGTIKTSNSKGTLYQSNIIKVDHTVLTKDEVKLTFIDDKGNSVSQLTFYNTLTNGRLTVGNYSVCDVAETDKHGKVKSALWTRHPANPSVVWGWMYYYKSGNVAVSVSGDTYTITFDNVQTNSTTDFEAETITCSYTGKLVYEKEYLEVSSVQLDKSTLSLELGKSSQLTATVNPTNAFNKKITWSSSNSDIVTIDEYGNLFAKGVGVSTITVKTEDGAKTASCVVTVNALPAIGSGSFSNNSSQSIAVTRATYWINEKKLEEIDLSFYSEAVANSQLSLVLNRNSTDTGPLKAGTYSTISQLSTDKLGVKYSYTNTGTVTVSVSGDQYTITLDLTTGDGIKITGSYSGKLAK